MNKFFNIIFILVVVVSALFYRDTLKNVWTQSFSYYFPCKQPIKYSLGTFDTRFGMSKESFLEALQDAEEIWEKPISKNLFEYSEGGGLKINLIYDARQDTTFQLKNIGIVVENTRASYDALKSKYNSLTSEYLQMKSTFEARIADFNSRKAKYEAEVAQTNRRGGANKETYNRLEAERQYLNEEVNVLQQLQNNLNSKVNDINAVVSALNDVAKNLNINVDKYNSIGENLDREFNEGVYKSDADGAEIDIYQFDNRTKLIRVLAHEFGHALGLDHIEEPKAIMYRLNNGVNEKLTSGDLTILKDLCGIK